MPMNKKRQLLVVVVLLTGMAALGAYFDNRDVANLCGVMAGIGALMVGCGFRKGFRVVCKECGDSVFLPETEANKAKTKLISMGWCLEDLHDTCPQCVKRSCK